MAKVVARPPGTLNCGCLVGDSSSGGCDCVSRDRGEGTVVKGKLDARSIRMAWCNTDGLRGGPARGEMFETIGKYDVDIIGFVDHGLRDNQWTSVKIEADRCWGDSRKAVWAMSKASPAKHKLARWRGWKVVMGGDYNATLWEGSSHTSRPDDNYFLNWMRKYGMVNALGRSANQDRLDDLHTWSRRESKSWIDHVLVGEEDYSSMANQGGVWYENWNNGDHYPVWVDLFWEGWAGESEYERYEWPKRKLKPKDSTAKEKYGELLQEMWEAGDGEELHARLGGIQHEVTQGQWSKVASELLLTVNNVMMAAG